jgi:proline iminopeptidase
MTGLYPQSAPHAEGLLDVGDGNRVWWSSSGNPAGQPVLCLHGGPGSGSGSWVTRLFDPAAYRVIRFDQRGCGRSTPHASDPATDLSVNTTAHLLADIERLREHLGVERWLVFGGSWGCVLGLRYAELNPRRVTGLLLVGIATGRRAETDLLTRGLGQYFPEAWERFREPVPQDARDGDLTVAYDRLLNDPDPAVRERAARAWGAWEDAIDVGGGSRLATAPLPYLTAFTRIVAHYWSHGSWLDEGRVLADADALRGIPGVAVQGVLDPGNLLGTPWLLTRAWPDCELVMVGDAGHSAAGADVSRALAAAADTFRR